MYLLSAFLQSEVSSIQMAQSWFYFSNIAAGSYSIGKAPMGSSTHKAEDSRPNSVDTILKEDESVRATPSSAPREKLKTQVRRVWKLK